VYLTYLAAFAAPLVLSEANRDSDGHDTREERNRFAMALNYCFSK